MLLIAMDHKVALGSRENSHSRLHLPGVDLVVSSETTNIESSARKRRAEANPVILTAVRRPDGTYDVEASDGGPPNFLINFQTKAEAAAWINKLKGLPTLD